MNAGPLISVILPVRNEAGSLPALLESLAQQDFPSRAFEIIVADGASTDATREIVQNFALESPVTVKLIDNPGIRSGSGRNAGLQVARGEYILFIDGHCHIPSVHLLSNTVSLFQSTNAECLCRPQPLLAPTQSSFGAAVAAVRSSILGHGRDSLIYDLTTSGFVDPASSGAAYRRSVFTQIGTYDESFDACEDVELNTRVRKSGMKAFADPRLAVFYEPRTHLSPLLKQMVRYGRGRVRLMAKHRDSISPGQIAPAFLILWFVLALVCLVVRIPGPTWLRQGIFAPVFLYVVAVLLSSISLAFKAGIRLLWQAPPIYLAIHVGLGIGLWTEAIRQAAHLLARRASLRTADLTEC